MTKYVINMTVDEFLETNPKRGAIISNYNYFDVDDSYLEGCAKLGVVVSAVHIESLLAGNKIETADGILSVYEEDVTDTYDFTHELYNRLYDKIDLRKVLKPYQIEEVEFDTSLKKCIYCGEYDFECDCSEPEYKVEEAGEIAYLTTEGTLHLYMEIAKYANNNIEYEIGEIFDDSINGYVNGGKIY